jgi:hypothetical protein
MGGSTPAVYLPTVNTITVATQTSTTGTVTDDGSPCP